MIIVVHQSHYVPSSAANNALYQSAPIEFYVASCLIVCPSYAINRQHVKILFLTQAPHQQVKNGHVSAQSETQYIRV